MQDFLRKIKLINHFTIELQMDKQTFVNRLSAITDEGRTGLFSNPFEVFSSNKKAYKGHVAFDEFTIKKQAKSFDTNYNLCTVKGTFKENNGRLTIETDVNGLKGYITILLIFLILFYSFVIFVIITDKEAPLFLLPFIIIQGGFMISFAYFSMKRSVERAIYDLEREFFYLTKND